MFMKKLTFFLVLFTLTLTGTLFSQNLNDGYKKIDYISVSQSEVSSFMNLAVNDLTNAYQQLIAESDLIDWRLYYVEYPGGEKSGYNFVSIASAPDLATFEDIFSDISANRYVPPEAQISSLSNKIVKTELWKVEDAIGDSSRNQNNPSKYMTMDYMEVSQGKYPDYLMLEDEVAKPIHSERINEDIMAGWEVYSLITPGGVEYGYNFATGNYYDELSNIEYGFTDEIINQAMGENANIPELFNTIYETRDLVKIELWKLAAHTE
ncbi:hypothetical protein Asal01_02600 [Fodinibius salicampi]